MLFYIAELSKYLIAILTLIYTVISLVYFFKVKNPYKNTWVFVTQRVIIFVIQMIAYITMSLRTGKYEYVFYGIFILIFILFVLSITNLIYTKVDKALLNNMCLMLGFGFIILTRLDTSKAIKQFGICIVAVIIAMFIPYIISNASFLKDMSIAYAVCGILPLLVVLLLGQLTHGSKISYSVFGITVQPSEFVKVIFVFCIAAILSKTKNFSGYFVSAIIAAVHVLILVASRDLGSAVIFFIAYIVMLYISSRNKLYLLTCLVSGVLASVVAYMLFSHVRVRVQAFLDPFGAIDNQGYQITQSLFALSCGSFFGTGLMKGVPGDIPFVESDFIFSALGEELGILVGIGILLICFFSFAIILKNAYKETDKFYKYIEIGLGTIYVFQVFLTVGGGIKFIPLTGVTLPFISYGGSSVLTSIIMFYIIEGIISARREKEYDEWIELLEDDDDDSFEEFIEYIDWTNEHIKGLSKKKRLKYRFFETRFTIVVFAIIYLAMSTYLFIYVKNNERELINNSYNSRQSMLAKENVRGKIFDKNGVVLAQTLADENGNEYRFYPYANMFSHVIGFTSKGKTGVEAIGNYYLINSDLSLSKKVDNDIANKKNAGNNVFTTLDYNLQDIAYRAMSMYKGAVIVSDVKTGDILALVSKPDFDPNSILQDWDGYVADNESGVLLNRVTQGVYPPGSTFKILTALQYIRENPVDYMNYRYNCSGRLTADDGIDVKCYHGAVHGALNFQSSFAKSCNCSFANIGLNIDRNSFGKTLNDCMFNQKFDFDFATSSSNLVVDSAVSDYNISQISFGQGKAVMTPLLLNMITNAIANNGVCMSPKIMDKAVSDDGTVLNKWNTSEYKSIMTPSEAETMTNLMRSVVKDGTGKVLKNASYNPVCKTGSAEFLSSTTDSHAWFTGFAPANNPEISITIIVENIGSGGEYAVPIAKRIFDVYFDEFE